MGWMQRLVQTYDAMQGTNAFEEAEHPLVPVGFIGKKAAIHVVLTEEGTFAYAVRFEKGKEVQVVPCSPKAEGRAGTKPDPFPLCDELQYVAGDFSEGSNQYFDSYIADLSDWCGQPDAPQQLGLLRDYLAERRLVSDMRACGFPVDKGKDAKDIVCFSVQSFENEEQALWRRADIRESWLNWLNGQMASGELCYVTGDILPVLGKHPKVQGNARLISAKDAKTPFQYRGRFEDASQALTVSYEASIKAHNALIWLMKRQGFDRYGLKVVAWATNGCPMESPASDDGPNLMAETDMLPDTFEAYSKALRDSADGYQKKLDDWKQDALNRVVILGLETATTGRMSINYYQEMPGGEYVQRLLRWYESCKWEVRHLEGPKENRRMVQRIWTPTPLEIATVVLGKRSADIARGDNRNEKSATKLMRQLRLRILKCTVEAIPLPHDIVVSAIRRASTPLAFTDGNGRWLEYEWRIALSVACALIRKEQADNREEEINVKLDEGNHDRSYLYGRLLALADMVEYSAMDKNVYRQTNAIRYMQIFQQRPFEIWPRLHTLIRPYMGKLGVYSERFKKLIGQVEELFNEGDRESREPLNGMYLQGYYCQRQALFTKKDEAKGADTHDDSKE